VRCLQPKMRAAFAYVVGGRFYTVHHPCILSMGLEMPTLLEIVLEAVLLIQPPVKIPFSGADIVTEPL
jgi:hypothetical protein